MMGFDEGTNGFFPGDKVDANWKNHVLVTLIMAFYYSMVYAPPRAPSKKVLQFYQLSKKINRHKSGALE
jgi:hypothetical protein